MSDTRVIYITGTGHSGSTLLDLLLGSHPQVTSLGEITNLTRYVLANGTCTCRQPIRECPFWNQVRQEVRRAHGIDIFAEPQSFPVSLATTDRGVLASLRKAQNFALAGLGHLPPPRLEMLSCGFAPAWRIAENAFALFDAVRAVSACDAIVDSSKWHTQMKWLWMVRPSQVKVIYLVRDGRGTMASYRRKGKTSEQAVREWVRTQTLTRLMLHSMPQSAWLFVRYEDLCSHPEGELARICRFVSLHFAKRMLRFADVVHHNIDGNHMRFSTSSDIVNPEAWRHKLSAADLRLFERIGGRLNRRLGYPATDPSLLSQ